MAIVSFEQIKKLYPDQVSGIAAGFTTPLGPTSDSSRPTLFDPDWGYFTFTQELGIEYDQNDAYESQATFTIDGVFTRNAVAGQHNPNISDETSFLALVGKYEALRAKFKTAAQAILPTNVSDWNGSNDPRTIALPTPLKDQDGNTIYALPVEFSVQPGQWPLEVKYHAVLAELKTPSTQIMINGQIIDDAIINIDLPRPILSRTPLIGCVGEIIQVTNYSAMEMEIAGTVPLIPPSGNSAFTQPSGSHMYSLRSRQIMAALQPSTVMLEMVVPSGGSFNRSTLYQYLTRVPPTQFDLSNDEGMLQVSVRCRE